MNNDMSCSTKSSQKLNILQILYKRPDIKKPFQISVRHSINIIEKYKWIYNKTIVQKGEKVSGEI